LDRTREDSEPGNSSTTRADETVGGIPKIWLRQLFEGITTHPFQAHRRIRRRGNSGAIGFIYHFAEPEAPPLTALLVLRNSPRGTGLTNRDHQCQPWTAKSSRINSLVVARKEGTALSRLRPVSPSRHDDLVDPGVLDQDTQDALARIT
jgi:hypothetical protein